MSSRGIFGAVIGSFLNVVIHRVPREESIVLAEFTVSFLRSCDRFLRQRAGVELPDARWPLPRMQGTHLGALPGGGGADCVALGRSRLARWPQFRPAVRSGIRDGHYCLIFIDAEHMILPTRSLIQASRLHLLLALPFLPHGRATLRRSAHALNGVLAGMPILARR